MGVNQRGAVVIIVVLGLVAIIGVAGLALDLAHAYTGKTQIQNALDAAALSAAKTLNTGAATTAAAADGAATFNINTNGEMVSQSISVSFEFSATLEPFVSGATSSSEPPAKFVRARVVGFKSPLLLARVLPGVGASINLGGTAVAGPSPPLGQAPPQMLCDIAPVVACVSSPTDPNYGFDTTQIYELKINSQTETDPIGPGNFQLINPGCGTGADCTRDSLAGNYTGCAYNGESVPTSPGDKTGAVAQGFNTRFGMYDGPYNSPTSNAQSNFPPDVVTSPAPQSGPGTQHFLYEQYRSAVQSENYDYAPVTQGGIGVAERRILPVPMGNCTGLQNGVSDIPVVGFGCFYMTQPASHQGNTQVIYAQFIDHCLATGNMTSPSEGPVGGTGPYKIILYKDTDSRDS